MKTFLFFILSISTSNMLKLIKAKYPKYLSLLFDGKDCFCISCPKQNHVFEKGNLCAFIVAIFLKLGCDANNDTTETLQRFCIVLSYS